MKTMTFNDLTAGMVLNYSDMVNNSDWVVRDTNTDRFGTWVNVLNKETNKVELMAGRTEIGFRWKIVKAA